MDGPSRMRRRFAVPVVVALLLVPLAVASPASAARCVGAGATAQAGWTSPDLQCLVNRSRSWRGLRTLRTDRRLAAAASAHAADMVARRYFGHVSPTGGMLADRLARAGVRSEFAGEALGWGCGAQALTPAILRKWLASPGHRRVLLGDFTSIGIAAAFGTPGVGCPFGLTWALVAAR